MNRPRIQQFLVTKLPRKNDGKTGSLPKKNDDVLLHSHVEAVPKDGQHQIHQHQACRDAEMFRKRLPRCWGIIVSRIYVVDPFFNLFLVYMGENTAETSKLSKAHVAADL